MHRVFTSRSLAYGLILTLVGSLFSILLPGYDNSFASHENITVNVSGDEVTESYDPGDAVAVEGVIDEIVDNEDITIRFKKPTGTTQETVNFGEPSSNGNFDAVFDIPNSANEGVWTVEVDYDSEQSYTYFIVDDDADTIQVVLDEDNGIYEAGSDVTISGQVDNDELSTDEFVRIIVLDPANDEILDEDEVQLGEGTLPNDEFE